MRACAPRSPSADSDADVTAAFRGASHPYIMRSFELWVASLGVR